MAADLKIKHIGVTGLGTMGSGIAQVIAQAGYRVKVVDKEQALVDHGLGSIKKSLEYLIHKGSLQGKETGEILSRIQGTTDLQSLSDCDLIVEAVFEDLEVKKDLFRKLDEICLPETILTTNTSSLSVTQLASGLSHMDRIIGLHFFNPIQVMKLVEVIKTITSSREVIETLLEFVRSIGKEPILVRDQGGFLVNYLLTPFLFDAIRALSEGISTVQEIDYAMRYGCGHPMGPLALCDLIGLDILVKAGNILFDEYRQEKYAPPPILRRLVEVGNLGAKSGRGFYDYQDPRKPIPRNFRDL
jgi:3-hydroxybutyryl-CoA dehydrogenase